MSLQYYVRSTETPPKDYGPFSLDAVKAMLTVGKIQSDWLICQQLPNGQYSTFVPISTLQAQTTTLAPASQPNAFAKSEATLPRYDFSQNTDGIGLILLGAFLIFLGSLFWAAGVTRNEGEIIFIGSIPSFIGSIVLAIGIIKKGIFLHLRTLTLQNDQIITLLTRIAQSRERQ